MRSRRDSSILREQESRGYRSQEKANYTAIDEAIVEECNFIWRPVNFYDAI